MPFRFSRYAKIKRVQNNIMWLWIILSIVLIVLVSSHGIEMLFISYDANYEISLHILLFGKFKIFEKRHIKIKPQKDKSQKTSLGFIRYIRVKIIIDYTVNVLKLNETKAIVHSIMYSILGMLNTFGEFMVCENVYFVFSGLAIRVRVKTGILNILLGFIKYQYNTRFTSCNKTSRGALNRN